MRVVHTAKESLAIIKQQVAKKIRVTGITLPDPNSGDQIQLLVDRPEDLELVERQVPPTQAFLMSLIGLIAAFGLSVLWIKMLRSQVAASTQTERMVSAQLRSSYEAIADGVLATDNENKVLAVNSEFCRICGRNIEIGDEVQKIHEAFAARSSEPETLSRLHPQSIASNDSQVTFEMELDSKEKHSTYLTVQLAPITGEDGKQSLGNLLVVRDETKNRQLQAELMHSNKLDAIGRLVGGVAHDFNNILTAVTANITLARMEEDATVRDVTKVLEIAEDAAFRGADIIRRLLTYSLREKYSLEPHRINSIIERLRELICHTFDATIEFEFDLDGTNPVVMVEGTALEQVLLNLYVNAKDAMPDGGKIKTTTRVLRNPATDADCVVVEVEDTGPGVPAEIKDKIFEPYFTTKTKEHGTGLGLSVSYSVIQQHGGLLQHLDRREGGSTFQITLPRHVETIEEPVTGRFDVPKGNGTILVVDDEEIVRNGAVMMLSRQGFQTISASGGE
ncbi:MAG: ATP-binding protein [Planctomycetota bacterium]